ncbi:hypothetical protein V6N13_045296 [Hibiscus sabdariffa]|uniref:Translation elongation factor EFTu-like domain-containing protein n=1 Tax=Hibiscus sabdariffa TaxID=183260 RepID=A0ABR2RL36_9ROSI
MPVEDVFSIEGRGAVVTGRIELGAIEVNDEVEILGLMQAYMHDGPLETTVTLIGVNMFKTMVDQAQASENVGLLKSLKLEDVKTGMVIAKPGTLKSFTKFEAAVYVRTLAEGGGIISLGPLFKPQDFLRTTDETATVDLFGLISTIIPGNYATAVFKLVMPMPLETAVLVALLFGSHLSMYNIMIAIHTQAAEIRSSYVLICARVPLLLPNALCSSDIDVQDQCCSS